MKYAIPSGDLEHLRRLRAEAEAADARAGEADAKRALAHLRLETVVRDVATRIAPGVETFSVHLDVGMLTISEEGGS